METTNANIEELKLLNGEKKMTRNLDVQKIFENTDDSLQGVLGHHFYVLALYHSADDFDKIREYLPNVSDKPTVDAFPMTFSWHRYYRKNELITTYMEPFFELYQSRVTLTTIVSVFDDFLSKLMFKLNSLGYNPVINGEKYSEKWTYRKKIKRAFFEARDCTIGDLKAIERLPKTFGIIDEGRRLRNLILHNHGIFDDRYGKEANEENNFEKYVHPDYRDSGYKIPVILTQADITNFSRAHLEVLHILHNQIQKKYFEHPVPYSYAEEEKVIRWNLAFWGNAELTTLRGSSNRETYLKI